VSRQAEGPWRAALAALAKPSAATGLVIVGIFAVASLAWPLLAPYSTSEPSCGVFEAPSAAHWLGCDDGGIDVLSLVLRGGAVSIFVGLTAALISIVVGTAFGVLSGYFGGWVDTVLMRITDYFIVVPQIVLMIAVAAVWGPSLSHIILVIGLLMWTTTARIIRAQTASIRQRGYVRRAIGMGAADPWIIIQHVLPQLGPLLVANAVLAITEAIFNETALAFLGLGDPTAVTWGTIMEHAFARDAISTGAWWAIVPAGVAVALLIVGCYLVGTAVEDAVNPRLGSPQLSRRTWRYRPLVGLGKDAL
jgi:peptide/nickel transport system permease protein